MRTVGRSYDTSELRKAAKAVPLRTPLSFGALAQDLSLWIGQAVVIGQLAAGTGFSGRVTRYPNKIHIAYREGLPKEQRWFVVFHELWHVLSGISCSAEPGVEADADEFAGLVCARVEQQRRRLAARPEAEIMLRRFAQEMGWTT